jgi:hypothetical protein
MKRSSARSFLPEKFFFIFWKFFEEKIFWDFGERGKSGENVLLNSFIYYILLFSFFFILCYVTLR